MEEYEVLKRIGHGAFGVVFKAVRRQTGETVPFGALQTRNTQRADWY
jgi:serine/threonine protein kinase